MVPALTEVRAQHRPESQLPRSITSKEIKGKGGDVVTSPDESSIMAPPEEGVL